MGTPVYGQDTIPIGGGESAKVGGMLHVDTIAVGTTAVTTEEDLMSYILPANTLLKDGQGVRIRAHFSLGANANNKTLKIYFGATAAIIVGPVASNAKDTILEVEVYRTGVGAQDVFTWYRISGSAGINNSPVRTEDETAAIEIKATGENGVATANDIVCEGMTVEFLNAE